MAPFGGGEYNRHMASSDGVTVTLRLFAIYRERVGQKCIEFSLQRGATVADALTSLGELHPATLPLMPTTMVAVNQDAKAPPIMALKASLERSFLLSGAIPPIPPS